MRFLYSACESKTWQDHRICSPDRMLWGKKGTKKQNKDKERAFSDGFDFRRVLSKTHTNSSDIHIAICSIMAAKWLYYYLFNYDSKVTILLFVQSCLQSDHIAILFNHDSKIAICYLFNNDSKVTTLLFLFNYDNKMSRTSQHNSLRGECAKSSWQQQHMNMNWPY
jgi:hypothetical protein